MPFSPAAMLGEDLPQLRPAQTTTPIGLDEIMLHLPSVQACGGVEEGSLDRGDRDPRLDRRVLRREAIWSGAAGRHGADDARRRESPRSAFGIPLSPRAERRSHRRSRLPARRQEQPPSIRHRARCAGGRARRHHGGARINWPSLTRLLIRPSFRPRSTSCRHATTPCCRSANSRTNKVAFEEQGVPALREP